MSFFPERYPIRAIKSVLYTISIFMLIFGGIYVLSEKNDPNLTFMDFVTVNNWGHMIAFICAFSLVFPLVTFSKRELNTSRKISEVKGLVKEIFTTSNYIVEKETENSVVFRNKSPITRIMKTFCEDAIRVDYEENIVKLEGRRADVYRFGNHIEYLEKDLDKKEEGL